MNTYILGFQRWRYSIVGRDGGGEDDDDGEDGVDGGAVGGSDDGESGERAHLERRESSLFRSISAGITGLLLATTRGWPPCLVTYDKVLAHFRGGPLM